jgi:hypothetical protein
MNQQSFFFKTSSGSFGFARAGMEGQIGLRCVRGFRPYYYYVTDDMVGLAGSENFYAEDNAVWGTVTKLDARPSASMIRNTYRLPDSPKIELEVPDMTPFGADQQERDLLMMEGISIHRLQADGTVKPKSNMTPLQETILQLLADRGEQSTSAIGKELEKPTAGINSALQALKKLKRVSDTSKDIGGGKIQLFWDVASVVASADV